MSFCLLCNNFVVGLKKANVNLQRLLTSGVSMLLLTHGVSMLLLTHGVSTLLLTSGVSTPLLTPGVCLLLLTPGVNAAVVVQQVYDVTLQPKRVTVICLSRFSLCFPPSPSASSRLVGPSKTLTGTERFGAVSNGFCLHL